jgi:hypothetical protein
VGLLNITSPSGFATKIPYAFLFSYMLAKCSNHLFLVDLVALIIFGEEYKS